MAGAFVASISYFIFTGETIRKPTKKMSLICTFCCLVGNTWNAESLGGYLTWESLENAEFLEYLFLRRIAAETGFSFYNPRKAGEDCPASAGNTVDFRIFLAFFVVAW
jgi:hypothetical protein